jgi:abortive infection bacteriophage resistance protein
MRIRWGFSLLETTTLARIPFTKRVLDLHGQAILLASRGLVFENWADAHLHLEHIGYYRFTGYLRPFRIGGANADAENFKPGTTFELAHDRYIFDRKLRMLIMEAVEKVEIAFKSSVSNALATRHGPHWYLDPALFARPSFWHRKKTLNIAQWHADFLVDVKRQIGHDDENRRDTFIKHYYDKYDRPHMPPCWMIFEVLSLGSVSHCFKFLRHPEYMDTCTKFGFSHQILSSWIHSISYVRNMCAHHSRVWNRILTIKPIIPNALRTEFNQQNDRVYAALLALQLMLQKIWGDNNWAEDLRDLVEAHPKIPLPSMGFPHDWKKRRVWGF